jgi:hypothetical protein
LRAEIPLFLAFCLVSTVSARAETARIPVSCEVAGKVDVGLDDQICSELISVLKQNYPDFSFSIGQEAAPVALTLVVLNASSSNLELNLKWRVASGNNTESGPISVAMMDKALTPARRQSLYLRALATAPMPKLD